MSKDINDMSPRMWHIFETAQRELEALNAELAASVHKADPGTIIQHTTNGGNRWRTLFILTTPNQWLVVPLDVPSLETDGSSVPSDYLHDIITNTPGIWEFCAEASWYR